MSSSSSSSRTTILLGSIIIVFIVLNSGIHSFARKESLDCDALLTFRESLIDPSGRLSSWKNQGCCQWLGVGCDESTGRVSRLDLGNLLTNKSYMLQGKILDSSPLSKLSFLTYLDLSWNDFQLSPIPLFIGGSMNQLQHLNLSHANFTGIFPHNLVNLSRLRVLDLSRNSFSGELPFLGNMNWLQYLDLSENQYKFSSNHNPYFLLPKNVAHVDLSSNNLYHNSDWISDLVSDKCSLRSLQLNANQLYGEISRVMTGCWINKLENLNLRGNYFNGTIPVFLGKLAALTELDISENNLSGPIPITLGKLSALRELRISSNMLSGPIPSSVGSLGDLTVLCLNGNRLSGDIPVSVGRLAKLHTFDVSHNRIGGEISDSFCMMKDLYKLDLSNNRFSGALPECWPNFQSLLIARLSSNHLTGFIPNSIGGAYSLQWLHLNNNNLTGQLPSTLKNCTLLRVLDVGDNNLSGNLFGYWTSSSCSAMVYLSFLILRNNAFYGPIPPAFCQFYRLQVMDVSNNKFTGYIPRCFGNFSGMTVINPSGFYNDSEWKSVALKQVMKGVQREYTTTSKYVVNLDLSNNYFVREIPLELTRLSVLIGLNLSRNHLGGKIPTKIGDLNLLESLDLSNNYLVEEIPQSLSALMFLSHLNLSNNNLSGPIPTGRQLQVLEDPSIYSGNPRLCGPPLVKSHSEEKPAPTPQEEEEEDDEDERLEEIYFYAVVISGYAIGLWGFVGLLLFKPTWRQALFRLVEVAVCKTLGY